MMIAQDVMTADPIRAQEDTPLSEALATMAEHDIRHLPVVRNEALVGIISDRDIRGLGVSLVNDEQGLQSLRQRMQRTVSEVMSTEVVSLDENDTLLDLQQVLDSFEFRHVPVTQDDRLIGLLSERDVLRYSASNLLPHGASQTRLLEGRYHVRDVMGFPRRGETFFGFLDAVFVYEFVEITVQLFINDV